MKITYRIDKQLNTVFTKVEGLVSVDDLIEQIKRIQADKRLKKNMNSLVDLSQAKPAKRIDFKKVTQYIKFLESIQESIGECKWAVIAPEDILFGLSHMSEILSAPLSIKIKIFRNEQEAWEWLGI